MTILGDVFIRAMCIGHPTTIDTFLVSRITLCVSSDNSLGRSRPTVMGPRKRINMRINQLS